VGTEAREWTSADAWILASVAITIEASQGVSGQGPDLSEVIAAADAVNHSIPTRGELASSLGALIAGGYVEVDEGRFRLSKDGERIRKHWTGGMFAWTSMLPALRKTERPDANFPMDQSNFDEAFRAYQRRFAKALRGLERRGR